MESLLFDKSLLGFVQVSVTFLRLMLVLFGAHGAKRTWLYYGSLAILLLQWLSIMFFGGRRFQLRLYATLLLAFAVFFEIVSTQRSRFSQTTLDSGHRVSSRI